jgi:hypothetical protein
MRKRVKEPVIPQGGEGSSVKVKVSGQALQIQALPLFFNPGRGRLWLWLHPAEFEIQA